MLMMRGYLPSTNTENSSQENVGYAPQTAEKANPPCTTMIEVGV